MRLRRRFLQASVALLAAGAMSLPAVAGAANDPGGGGSPEAVGNNLSNPTVFAEGVGITGTSSSATDPQLEPWQQTWTGLRVPSPTNPTLPPGPDGTYVKDGVTYYLQGTDLASWQAGWINGAASSPWTTNVKWGDNLLAPLVGNRPPWSTGSTIHIEMAMQSTSTLSAESGLSYFPTESLSGSASTETFGSTGVATSAVGQTPSVYSDAAYLTIQKLDKENGAPVGDPIHVLTTWNRSGEGPSTSTLTPEVNAAGNVVYSYNWFTGNDSLTEGWYRLSFGIVTSPDNPIGTPTTLGNAAVSGVVAPGAEEGGTGTPVPCGTPVVVTDESGNPVQIPLGCSATSFGTQSSLELQLAGGSGNRITITTTSLPDGQVGTPYDQTLTATGGKTPYTWSIESGSLPAGLSLDPSTGAITGTPTAAGSSSFAVKVTCSGASQRSATANLSIKVAPPPAPGVTTGAASALSTTGATVSGTVNPNGAATTYHFAYGKTSAMALATPETNAGSSSSPQSVSAKLSGLTPATDYHYQLVATNVSGTTKGAEGTFTTPAPPGVLRPGDRLTAGQTRASKPFTLIMQSDGNLVEYVTEPGGNSFPLFSTNTYNHPGAYAVMQGDGNLVVYSSTHHPLWSTSTYNHPGAYANLQGDGNFVVYTPDRTALWWTGTAVSNFPPVPPNGASVLSANQGLPAGSRLTNGQYALVMQADGNLVEYKTVDGNSTPVWFTGSDNHPGAWAIMQGDGNFVVYDLRHHPLWDAGTANNPGARLELRSNGQVVVVTPNAKVIVVH